MQNLLRRGIVISFVFVSLSLGSALYVFTATVNYNRLYPALGVLATQLGTVSVVKATVPSQTRLLVHVAISNPTDYSGFSLADVSIVLSAPSNQSNSFVAQYETMSSSRFLGGSLGPHTTRATDVAVSLPEQNATFLYNSDPQTTSRLSVHVKAAFDIITFLDPVTGRVPIEAERDLFLTN